MANVCLMSLSGIPYECDVNLAGIKTLYLTDWNNVLDIVAPGDTIEDIEMKEKTYFEKYVFAKNTGSLTKTMTKDDSKGTRYFLNEFTCNFNKMNAEKRKELNELGAGQIAAIVEDMNNIYWYLGKDNYCTATAVTGQSGATTDDGNFYSLTIQDMSASLPYPIDSSIISKLTTKPVANEG